MTKKNWDKALNYLRNLFPDLTDEDIDDAMSQVQLRMIDEQTAVEHPLTYITQGARLLLQNERKRAKQNVSIDDVSESELCYAGADADRKMDIARAMAHYTEEERAALYLALSENASTVEIAREFPSRNQSSWYVWIYRKAVPELRRNLKEYRDTVRNRDERSRKAA